MVSDSLCLLYRAFPGCYPIATRSDDHLGHPFSDGPVGVGSLPGLAPELDWLKSILGQLLQDRVPRRPTYLVDRVAVDHC